MTQIFMIISQHAIDMLIVTTNGLLFHVTWRTLPEEKRHSFRRFFGLARRYERKVAARLARNIEHDVHTIEEKAE